MKALVAGIVIAAAVVFGFLFFRPESPIDRAIRAEKQGDTRQACEHYLEALLDETRFLEYPDEGRAGVLNRESYRKRIDQYVEWVSEGRSTTNEKAFQALGGIARCSSAVENEHLLLSDSLIPLDSSSYRHRFTQAFYPIAHDSGAVAAQAMDAMNNNLSILRIRSPRDFTYMGSLLDPNTYQQTEFTLFPESTIDLLVPPGRQALILQSEVTFQGGQVWRSPLNALWIEVPEQPTGINVALKTRVSRK